jgi:hypothetical protein
MIEFFSDFFVVLTGVLAGGILAGIFIIYQIRRNFFKPKLYFKHVQILPTKGDIEGNVFTWGGLIFTGDLHNDSDYWAYNVRIDDIYAEFQPQSKTKLVNKTPLRLATDLPRSENLSYFHNNTQLQNIKPGDKISTSIRILTKTAIPLSDYKQLITELKMIQIKAKIVYENSAGFRADTLFCLDFQYAKFVNLFGKRAPGDQLWKKIKSNPRKPIKVKSKIIEIETEPL